MPALLSLQPGASEADSPYRRRLDELIRERAGGAGSRDRSEPVSGAGAVRINRKRAVEAAAAAAEEETEGFFRGKRWKDPGGQRGETQLRRERRGVGLPLLRDEGLRPRGVSAEEPGPGWWWW